MHGNCYRVRISPASVYHILTNSLGKRKVCAKWIPHMLNDDQRAMRVLLASTHLQHWLYHPVPVGTMVNGPYYCSLLQAKVMQALCRKQPEMLELGAILLQDNATPHCHNDVQNLVQRWGWEVLAHPPYSPDLAPCVLTCERTSSGKTI
jgi:hypothetical protein